MTHDSQLQRTPSQIDALADAYVAKLAEISPTFATEVGLPGDHGSWGDLSPAGHDALAELNRQTLAQLSDVEPIDDVDAVTVAAMRERIGLDLELHDAGLSQSTLNNIASPIQGLRDIFDITPTDTAENWQDIASRLNSLPEAMEGVIESWRYGFSRGNVPAIRQVEACIKQAKEQADKDTSFFTSFIKGEKADAVLGDSSTCATIRKELEHGAVEARRAYDLAAQFLTTEATKVACASDAVGRDRYALHSRQFLGATIDLDETYEWGIAELDRVIAEQEAVAAEIAGPGATVEDAVAKLDADPSRQLHGTDALQEWMQRTSDAAIEALNGEHFDIPEPVQRLECCIAPTQTGGIYYTPPSDDFSRPGRMWWSVPPSVTVFNTWRELTTVYHEGVPGHHLQLGQAVYARHTLNNWRRLACWVSGHGEGWALYAERLMADLGHLDDPADRLGMLDAQRLRAARVVFDIGQHLQLPVPERWGSGTWDPQQGWGFLLRNVNMPEDFVRFEFERYLGWPGQAPSYKVGQRLWEQIRDEAAASAAARGEEFSLKGFHARALNLGSVGLDVLRGALTDTSDGN